MMQPKKTKFRKAHKGRIHGTATSGATLSFGQFGLKAMAPERITARQIEAARRALTRHMKRAGRVWIRIFPDVPVSKKPAEVRMGSGKGTPELWVARVKPGRVIFEIDGVTGQTAKERLARAAPKLPSTTRFVARSAEWGRDQGRDKNRRYPRNEPRSDGRRRPQSEEGALQPAFPARHRAAGEHVAAALSSPRHRPHQDHRRAEARREEVRGRHAKTYASRCGRQRQASQDGCGARRPPLYPSDLQEDDSTLEKLPCARREQRVQAGRPGVDRGKQADLETEALDRGPGRTEENGLRSA